MSFFDSFYAFGLNNSQIIIYKDYYLNKVTLNYNSLVSALAILPNSNSIVSSGPDENIKIWNSNTFELIATLDDSYSAMSLVILPESLNIVSGHDDSTITIWSSITFEIITVLYGHESRVLTLAILPETNYIVSGSHDGTIKIWESEYPFNNIATLIANENEYNLVYSLAISPVSNNIISGNWDRTIKIWNSTSFELIQTLFGHDRAVNALLVIILSNTLLEIIVSGSEV